MAVSFVLTVIGPDRPGIVEALSDAIVSHQGNWLESRMSQLAGKFAGILHASVPDAEADALESTLRSLETRELKIVIERSTAAPRGTPAKLHRLELLGSDQPGIMRAVSRILAERKISVEELFTECTSAPMSGDMLFKATAQLKLAPGASIDGLRSSLEQLENDLMVDISLDDL